MYNPIDYEEVALKYLPQCNPTPSGYIVCRTIRDGNNDSSDDEGDGGEVPPSSSVARPDAQLKFEFRESMYRAAEHYPFKCKEIADVLPSLIASYPSNNDTQQLSFLGCAVLVDKMLESINRRPPIIIKKGSGANMVHDLCLCHMYCIDVPKHNWFFYTGNNRESLVDFFSTCFEEEPISFCMYYATLREEEPMNEQNVLSPQCVDVPFLWKLQEKQ